MLLEDRNYSVTAEEIPDITKINSWQAHKVAKDTHKIAQIIDKRSLRTVCPAAYKAIQEEKKKLKEQREKAKKTRVKVQAKKEDEILRQAEEIKRKRSL